jgi:hypothetical protein
MEAQSDSINSATKSDSRSGLGKIGAHLSGSLFNSKIKIEFNRKFNGKFLNLMPTLFQSRSGSVRLSLKKSGTVMLDDAVPIDRMSAFFGPTSIDNMTSARKKLELKANDAGIPAIDYHSLRKTPVSKIRSNEFELELLYHSPKQVTKPKPPAHISEVEYGRESVLKEDARQIAAPDLEQFSDQICSIIEKRLKVERERRGIYG